MLRKGVQSPGSPESLLSPNQLMEANAVRWSFQEVLDQLDELELPVDEDWDDVLASQPGPEETGELGVILDEELE